MATYSYLCSLSVMLAITAQVLSLSRDPCANFICQNGGSCTAPADAPSCICQAGFFGEHCEYNRDPCYKFGCLNGGYCTAPADAPYCVCPPGFSGLKCETKGNSLCPVLNSNSVGVCGGIFCSSDADCSNGSICCASACGSKLCTALQREEDGPECPGGCAPGYKCELKSPPCKPGMMCAMVMLPTCVPIPVDQCGGCPKGKVCKSTGIVCIRAPCPSWQCVDETAPAVCNLACARNQVCQLKVPDCPRNRRCSTRPVPQCVPKPIQLATCPKPAQNGNVSACLRQKPQNCSSDRDCGRYERCCPSPCRNRRQCTRVPVL